LLSTLARPGFGWKAVTESLIASFYDPPNLLKYLERYMYRSSAPLGSTRTKLAVILRMSSDALPQRATHFSAGTAVVSRACPPPWGRCAALTRRKTRNQFFQRYS